MESSNLISFGLPTYNRAHLLRETLDYYYDVLHLGGYQLLISDNNSTDGTANICREYADRYDNITFYRQKSNIGADANMTFLQDKCETEYFMLLGDGVRFNVKEFQTILELVATRKYDVICYDYNERTRHRFPTGEYDDSNKFLREAAWYVTQMSSYVLSKRVIDFTKNRGIGLYPGSEFRYYARMFDYAAFNPIKYYWLDIDSMHFSQIAKGNEWTPRKIDIWFGEYVSTIMSLPAQYSLESKMSCLKETSQYYFFTRETLLNDIINGVLTKENLQRNKYGFILMLGEDRYNYYLKMIEQPKLQILKEIDKPNKVSLYKKIKRKVKKTIKKLLHHGV